MNAKHRDHIITRAPPTAQCADDTVEVQPSAPMSWMQRLRRVFAIDLRRCPRCGGGPVRVIAAIPQPALVARILEQRRDDNRRASVASRRPNTCAERRFARLKFLSAQTTTAYARYPEPMSVPANGPFREGDARVSCYDKTVHDTKREYARV